MRALELSLRNYRMFEEVDLELPARVIGIFGTNGSGKSTLMESLLFALYGRARTRRQEIRTHGVLTDCGVRLVFEHGGSQYEVRRAIRGRNHATDAELFVGDLQLASGVTDVDAEVQRLLRMDQQVFRASAFAEQKQLDAFSDVTAGKRKEMVLRLLGIRPVDDARTVARRESRATRQRANDLGGELTDVSELEARLRSAHEAVLAARAVGERAGSALKAAVRDERAAAKAFEQADRARERAEKLSVRREGLLEQQKATEESRAGLAERLERLAEELGELPAFREELASLAGVVELHKRAERLAESTSALQKISEMLAELPEANPEAASVDLADAEAASATASKAAAEAGARAAHAKEQLTAEQGRAARAGEADPSEPCPTCGRELGDDFAEYQKHARGEVKAAEQRVKDLVAQATRASKASEKAGRARTAASRAFEAIRKAADERARLAAHAETLRVEAASLREGFGDLEPDLDVLGFGVGRERDLERKVAGLDQQVAHREETERHLVTADAALGGILQQLEMLDAEVDALAFDPPAHEEARTVSLAARDALERARTAEREAADAMATAEREHSGLEGGLRRARETAVRVEEIRADARYFERVTLLLDGFRDHLVARVGPELSREAEALFRELTNHEYDDLTIDDQDLAIRIADGDTYFGIERFSGSEADLANLALRVAISSHLSRVSGADVGLMVLDEVLASLDVERKDLMVQALGRLGARFHQLFVITHAEQVKDTFPASIEVRKTGRRRSEALLV